MGGGRDQGRKASGIGLVLFSPQEEKWRLNKVDLPKVTGNKEQNQVSNTFSDSNFNVLSCNKLSSTGGQVENEPKGRGDWYRKGDSNTKVSSKYKYFYISYFLGRFPSYSVLSLPALLQPNHAQYQPPYTYLQLHLQFILFHDKTLLVVKSGIPAYNSSFCLLYKVNKPCAHELFLNPKHWHKSGSIVMQYNLKFSKPVID